MKKIITPFILFLAISSSAQIRTSLYEEFTSENDYQWAPGDQVLNATLQSNAGLVIPIKWMTAIPSAPSPTWSLYQNNKAEFNWRYRSSSGSTLAAGPSTMGYGYPSQNTSTSTAINGINTIPTGRLDGQHQWNFGAASDHPADLSNGVILSAQTVTTNFRLAMTPSWSPTFTNCVVTVTISAINSFTSVGAFMFRLCLIERALHFATPPGMNGQMHFYDVVRKSYPTTVLSGSVTDMGTVLPSIWAPSQTQTLSISCDIPSYIRDLSEMAFVGFIQDDGDRQIYQAGRTAQPAVPNDVKAVSLNIPVNCFTNFSPSFIIQNLGPTAVSALTVAPYIDAVAQTPFTYNGSIAGNSTATITLPTYTAAQGGHTFSATITGVSGGDLNTINNTTRTAFGISTILSPSVSQSFPGFPPTNWYVLNYDFTPPSWGFSSVGGYTTNGGSAKYDFYNNLVLGDVDDLFFPALNLAGVTNPVLSFDVAYAQNSNQNDKLEVKVSTNCGTTWSTVYSQQGAALATAPPTANNFVPTPTQWRTEVVSLPSLSNKPSVLVKFVATSDWGNNLYIDNVNLSQSTSLEKITEKEVNCVLFPNPSSGAATLSIASQKNRTATISILNSIGQLIHTTQSDLGVGITDINLHTENLASGVYFVRVTSEGNVINKKLNIIK